MSAGILAQLIAQGTAGGADLATLRAIAEEAGELGATRALTRLGLAGDEAAVRAMLRGLSVTELDSTPLSDALRRAFGDDAGAEMTGSIVTGPSAGSSSRPVHLI